jgi:hypothetical protein
LKTIEDCFNREKNDAHKPSWLSMVSNLETKEHLLDLGFQIGSRVFAAANRRVAKGKGGMFDKPTGRPKKVTLKQLLKIKELLKQPENSFPAAQKTISHRIFDSTSHDFLTPKKVTQFCYYVEHTMGILYLDYLDLDLGGSFRETTFRLGKQLKSIFLITKKHARKVTCVTTVSMAKSLKKA